MTYTVEYAPEVVAKHIPKLPQSIKKIIAKAIENRLMVDPLGYGKPLRHSLSGYRRLRVSDYRIVYKIYPEKKSVMIFAIKHRKDIYEDDISL